MLAVAEYLQVCLAGMAKVRQSLIAVISETLKRVKRHPAQAGFRYQALASRSGSARTAGRRGTVILAINNDISRIFRLVANS